MVVEGNYFCVVDNLLDFGVKLNVWDKNYDFLLIVVFCKGYSKMIIYFLKRGVDVEIVDKNKYIVFYLVVEKGYYYVLINLLKFGVIVNFSSDN